MTQTRRELGSRDSETWKLESRKARKLESREAIIANHVRALSKDGADGKPR